MTRFFAVFITSLLVLTTSLLSCRERGDANNVSLPSDGAFVGLRDVQARLTLTDAADTHPEMRVTSVSDLWFVALDVPLPCDGDICRATIDVDVGSYKALLIISAVDRCGSRRNVLRYTGRVESDHWQSVDVSLDLESAAFDADNDGVIDVLEATACGRFDLDDGIALPRFCDPVGESCCIDEVGLSGGQMTFAGRAAHTLPYDHDGVAGDDVVTVGEFVLDSTEFTWGALERCVAAGACLENQPEHPARLALVAGVDRALPVQGLTPTQAAAACAWFGRRLPRDAEWDFAAADRGTGPRARFPFDVNVGTAVGCTVSDAAPAAAFRAAGRACGDGKPVRVGSFITSAVTRGVGTPVSELAGNVAEWTVIGSGDGSVDEADFVVLRGGGVSSFLELLENDLPLVFAVGDDDARIATISAIAGFRCAADVVDTTPAEPACPADGVSPAPP